MQIGGRGESLESKEKFTSYPSKITKPLALRRVDKHLVISRLLEVVVSVFWL